MPTIRLLRIDPALAAALDQGNQHFEMSYGVYLGDMADIIREFLPPSLAISEAHPAPWGTYLTVDEHSSQVIGTCGFKSGPTAEGSVEIAYFTAPAFEGQGYATATARELVALAEGDPAVSQVIAHTLPEPNASGRILEKIGMRWIGEVWDPEDGRVWRWQRERAG